MAPIFISNLAVQGLEDHAHPPTLEALPRDLPIVAAPGAAAKCRSLGYSNVTELDHGQTVPVAGGRLTLTGTQGGSPGCPQPARPDVPLALPAQLDGSQPLCPAKEL